MWGKKNMGDRFTIERVGGRHVTTFRSRFRLQVRKSSTRTITNKTRYASCTSRHLLRLSNKLDLPKSRRCLPMGVSSDDGVSEPPPPAFGVGVPPRRNPIIFLAPSGLLGSLKLEVKKLELETSLRDNPADQRLSEALRTPFRTCGCRATPIHSFPPFERCVSTPLRVFPTHSVFPRACGARRPAGAA